MSLDETFAWSGNTTVLGARGQDTRSCDTGAGRRGVDCECCDQDLGRGSPDVPALNNHYPTQPACLQEPTLP